MMNMYKITLLLLCLLLLNACQTVSKPTMEPVAVMLANTELDEAALLDVGIEVFAPGPIDKNDAENKGLNEQIRRAEARFIAVHLKNTLQQTGFWGAVRVIPASVVGTELLIKGSILASDGETLTLHIIASDSLGEVWLDKHYTGTANLLDYQRQIVEKYDVFQTVYHQIANDLATLKQQKNQVQLSAIRQRSELKFAADLAPITFNKSLPKNQSTTLTDTSPAPSEAMLQRIQMIRERDYMLIDTYNEHYRNYYRDIWTPYSQWRQNRVQEAMSLREIENEAIARKSIGIGVMIGAIALTAVTGVDLSLLQAAMLAGGIYATKTGFDKDQEKKIHIAAMREMDASFEAEAAPMVVTVDGDVHKLTGSVETQYIKWHKLLDEMHLSETVAVEPKQ